MMGKFVLVAIGIIVAAVVLVEGAALIGSYRFSKMVDDEREAFLEKVKPGRQVVTEADLEGLPEIVQTWLKKAQVIGKTKIVSARTEQDVQLRLTKDQPWLSAKAVQYFRIEEPGFIWKVRIKAAPFFHIAGRDKYLDGQGNMLIKIMSLFKIADAKGPEVDQGSLLRYLGENIWFPTAALSDYLEWEQIDNLSAKATMAYQGVQASGIFTFTPQGELVKFEAKRYGEFDGEYRLETWVAEVGDYQEFNGFLIPTSGRITWKLADGDFEWYRFVVREMEYNN